MAVLVRSEHDLPTLRIKLDRRAFTRAEVLFQTVRGRGTPEDVGRCSTAELGLPETISSTTVPADEAFQLPRHLVEPLTNAVAALGAPADAPGSNFLWLELANPRGYLYLLPWERLLEPLHRPVLRLPNHAVRPKASARTLDVALCASAPMAKAMFDTAAVLEQLAGCWTQHSGHDVTLHLFSDSGAFSELIARSANLGPAVVVHNPEEAERFAAPERTSRVSNSMAVVNPWLRWVQHALEGGALDALHFVNHGFLSGDRGAIAFASTPVRNTDRTLSRFVGAAELTTFLAQVGAWTLMLTGPPRNYSGSGLRELADSVAHVHPGVTLVHELSIDPSAAQFTAMLDMVFAGGPPVTTPLPGITSWVHPRFVEYPGEEQEAFSFGGHPSLIKDATAYSISGEHTPAWVAAGARYLESQQSEWLPDDPDQSADPDAVAALEAVSSLLDAHVVRHLRQQEG